MSASLLGGEKTREGIEPPPAPGGAPKSPSLRVVLGNANNWKKVRSLLRLVPGDRQSPARLLITLPAFEEDPPQTSPALARMIMRPKVSRISH